LAEVGIHRIEAGMPAVSAQDEAAIKEIVKRNLGPEIFAFARCMKEDVKRKELRIAE
jgi:isopropylmalate/homocitrate/citramalate synthase